MQKKTVINLMNKERLEGFLWQLVKIPSPTGRERQAAMEFADLLKKAGAEVTIDEEIYESPNIIGKIKGKSPGKTLQLAGHIDHIDIEHPEPSRDNKTISGRGSADMKNGLAGILEIANVLKETGNDFAGEILVTVYGLHEAPRGDSSGLMNLITQKYTGDAAIVFEGSEEYAAVMANGMSIFNIELSDKNLSAHELCSNVDKNLLINKGIEVLHCLQEKNRELKNTKNKFPLLNSESVFVGQVHVGDFYNRIPNKVSIQGTRRWNPDKTFDDIKKDFEKTLCGIDLPNNISIKNIWNFVGESYQIDKNEAILSSLRQAYKNVHQSDMPVSGHGCVTDVCRLVRFGKIPAVLCGFDTRTGHKDFEFVDLENFYNCCKVALLTVLGYLNTKENI